MFKNVGLMLIMTLATACAVRLPNSLVWEDRFATLDEARWEKRSHSFASNLAQFDPANITCTDRKLTLRLQQAAIGEKAYTGAELRTKQSFRYGKFEVRMKAARGSGLVSAFFLYETKPEKGNNEIDIEFLGKNTHNIHLNYYPRPGSDSGIVFPLPHDAAESFHTYAIVWRRKAISWYVDGQHIHTATTHIPRKRQKLILNLWASATAHWAGEVSKNALPAAMEVEWVRWYR